MTRYAVPGAGTRVALILAQSGVVARYAVSSFSIGSRINPQNLRSVYTAQRTIGVSAGTTVTPVPLDPGTAAFLGTAKEGLSTVADFVADEELVEVPLFAKQRFTWRAAPRSELVIPADIAYGIGWKGDPFPLAWTVSIIFRV